MDADVGGSQLFATIEATACADPDVEFVVAFGSRITGTNPAGSDLDIAVKFDDTRSESQRFEKQCLLSGQLQEDEAPFADVTDIETLPTDVAHDAVNGLFVCGDEDAFEQYRAEVESAYDDRRDDLRRRQRAVIDRIAEDGLRGR